MSVDLYHWSGGAYFTAARPAFLLAARGELGNPKGEPAKTAASVCLPRRRLPGRPAAAAV